ncbi:hypothetical protein C463_07322 [Halorubrum californiense DSM 19288]|uniref:Uncharacterized protein n=1 Tax=Halorubrum californiense DSM 19288 TaxID=1227465 RepID=M0ECZ1_9EURY|nr:hypothetical protein C463_07322 [Halorubrum californiense DSM 19288]
MSLPRLGDREGAERDEDRAQIILITGLTLAVLFVAVVLLLNTVIYTENLATRGADAGGAEAIEFRDGAVEDLEGIMSREHRNVSDGNARNGFNASARTYARAVADFRARDGVIADVNVTRLDPGYFVYQNETDAGLRNMTDRNGADGWTVAAGVNRTRDYRLTLNSTSLSDDVDDAFTVVADGPDGNWSLTVSNGTAGAINVTVNNGSGDVPRTFSHTGANVTVDLTAGTVGDERFPHLDWAENVENDGEYAIRYRNGDRATGTYEFVVEDADESTSTNVSSRPYVVEGVYGVKVEILHRTPELMYRDVVRLAPGESDA